MLVFAQCSLHGVQAARLHMLGAHIMSGSASLGAALFSAYLKPKHTLLAGCSSAASAPPPLATSAGAGAAARTRSTSARAWSRSRVNLGQRPRTDQRQQFHPSQNCAGSPADTAQQHTGVLPHGSASGLPLAAGSPRAARKFMSACKKLRNAAGGPAGCCIACWEGRTAR